MYRKKTRDILEIVRISRWCDFRKFVFLCGIFKNNITSIIREKKMNLIKCLEYLRLAKNLPHPTLLLHKTKQFLSSNYHSKFIFWFDSYNGLPEEVSDETRLKIRSLRTAEHRIWTRSQTSPPLLWQRCRYVVVFWGACSQASPSSAHWWGASGWWW